MGRFGVGSEVVSSTNSCLRRNIRSDTRLAIQQCSLRRYSFSYGLAYLLQVRVVLDTGELQLGNQAPNQMTPSQTY